MAYVILNKVLSRVGLLIDTPSGNRRSWRIHHYESVSVQTPQRHAAERRRQEEGLGRYQEEAGHRHADDRLTTRRRSLSDRPPNFGSGGIFFP